MGTSFGGDVHHSRRHALQHRPRLGNPCLPEDQGSAATRLLENNPQKTQQGISTELLIGASQANLDLITVP